MFPRLCTAALLCTLLAACPKADPAGPDASPACVADCNGRLCGDDGCGGSCGGCVGNEACVEGVCRCVPRCEGRRCGDDGCGGQCGVCGPHEQCGESFLCEPRFCLPDCQGKDCGPDGCGGTCGAYRGGCPVDTACTTAHRCDPCPANCKDGQVCGPAENGCSCGTCPAGLSCTAAGRCEACTPKCDGRTCGSDGCGGVCGTCRAGEGCLDGQCLACTPGPECAGRSCGVDARGCSCGACPAALFCQRDGTCAACPDTGGSVTIDTLCSVLDGGFKKWFAFQYQSCGLTIDEADPAQLHLADIDQLDAEFYSGASYGYVYPVGAYDAVLTCSQELKEPYQALEAAARAGRVCFDSAAVEECMRLGADRKAAGDLGNFSPVGSRELPAVCSRFFVPNQREGQPCGHAWECQAGLYCKASDGGKASCEGVCAKPVKVGYPCTERDACAPGNHCAFVATANPPGHRCLPLPGEGESCASADCASGFVCDGSETCVPMVAAGQPCTVDSSGGSDCDPTLACLPDGTGDTTCQTPPAAAGQGGACAGPKGIPCADCLYCSGGSSTRTGKCTRMPRVGDPCASGGSCPSFGLLECDAKTNTCQLFPRQGRACTVDPASLEDPADLGKTQVGNCLYLDNYCKRPTPEAEGVCAAMPGLGEACANSHDSAPYCAGAAYCKGAGVGQPGRCAPWEPDGEPCTEAAMCESYLCLDPGVCGSPAKAGEPCALDLEGKEHCEASALCADVPVIPDPGAPDAGATMVTMRQCVAKKPGGAACTAKGECLSGLCGVDGVCAQACLAPPGTDTDGCGSYNGFNWFAKYIFAAGTLVFFALRRRRAA